jgi:uncharacterized alpha-E superfamily protein
MLSRVAERLYWLGRYIERAENTARLITVNHNLLLDLPTSANVLWESLLELLAGAAGFHEHNASITERGVVRWVVADERNAGSLVSSLRAARENARTVREVIPSESWELINDLYWSAQDTADSAVTRKSRQAYLDSIVLKSQQFAGMLHNTMSRREPFQFIMLGAKLERADMTSRIVDVGAASAIRGPGSGAVAAHENILWMNVLLSLSAYQMYRQQVRERVSGPDVVRFLLLDNSFPHAISWCIDELEHALALLPHNTTALRANRRVFQHLIKAQPEMMMDGGLHEFLDELQVELAALHEQVVKTWFTLRH